MSEIIELHSFRTTTARDGDIEEYHEVSQDLPASQASPTKHNSSRDYDFFTQEDVKIDHKGSSRKARTKRKERTPNLMDLISSELSSVVVPVAANVISLVEASAEQLNSCLVRTPQLQRVFQRFRSSPLDSERGWSQSDDIVTLHPVFPRVIENTTSDSLQIPVQYVEPASFDDVVSQYIDADINRSPKFLDIEIKNLKFKYHHQFSLEKLLSTKLVELYNDYSVLKQSIKDLDKEIKINRETRDNIKQEFLKITPNKKEDIRFDQTVRKYTGNLLVAKDKYLEVLHKEREMAHKITSLWSDIEMVRERTGVKETNYNMAVKEVILSKDEFDEEWDAVFNTEFNYMLERIEYEYVSKYLEYKEVKYTKNLDDSAKKKISKPKLNIDEEALKEEVEALVNNIVRKSKIELFLSTDSQPEFAKFAKSSMTHEYHFEIYVDDVFACQSECRTSQDMRISDINFSESFSLQILPNNTHLTIALYEYERDVASIRINLADIKNSESGSQFVVENFVYNDIIIAPNSKFVGSGHNIKEIAAETKVRLKSSNLFKGNLYTTCEVDIKVGWDDKLSQNENETLKSSMEVGRQLKRLMHGIDKPNIHTLTEIIGKLYDKDVTNDENLLNNLRRICKNKVKNEDTFPINESSPEIVRLKLLHLRNNGGFTGVENKMIPIHATQISTEQLNCLQRSSENELESQYFNDKCSEMDPIELQRFIGIKNVQKLNKNMLTNLKEHLMRKTHKDVVRDFKDLSLRSLFTNQVSLATLASISAGTRQQLLLEGLGKEQEVRVTVLRAFNLMDRSGEETETESQHIAGYKVRPLRPFVRVSYRGVAAQTVTAMGCHPTWNQTVKINTRLEPVSNLHINIYDELKTYSDAPGEDSLVSCRVQNRWIGAVVVPLYSVLSLGALRGTFKIATPPILFGYEHQTKESQSLIPAVNQLMKKDSCFISLNLTTSLSHLGGLHEHNQPRNTEDDYVIKHLNNFVTEFETDYPNRHISLTFIDSSGKNKCCTQFLQPLPLPDLECFPKNPKFRSESAVSKSSGWSKSSSTKSREEKISQSTEERESLYSGNESWTSKENHLTKCMEAAVRYVSLIPTYEVTEAYAVTLLGVELLKVLYGTPLDHTLLLASYFLHLGLRCYVAIGLGLPRGMSSCVLIKYDAVGRKYVMLGDKERHGLWGNDGYTWHVYDACSGDRAQLRDVACPLHTVEFVFDADNIWVNIQSSQDCQSMAFDFTKSSDWQPVFNKSMCVPAAPPAVAARPCGAAGRPERLRRALEARLRDRLLGWRPRARTVWHRYCSSLLREMLPHWEYWSFHPTEPKPAMSQRMKQLMATYKLYGFPLNIPYVNTKSVISAVKSTGVHACDDPSAEFALAVEVCAYPNNVISVWVFLACITRL